MGNPRVSILLPTYNRAEILPICIEAVIAQEFSDWELIVLDDCSEDNTQFIAEDFSKRDLRIHYHRNHIRKGLPLNRNVGISLSKGDLIFFIEDDLLLDKQCLYQILLSFDTVKKNGMLGGIAPRLIDDNPPSASISNQPFILNRLTGEIINNYSIIADSIIPVITMHACSLYPKAVLEEVGLYSGLFIGNYLREESDLNFRIAKKGYHFYYTSKAFAYHKRYPSGSFRKMPWRSYLYFSIRNHCVFVIRIFGARALYMIPFYLFNVCSRRMGVKLNIPRRKI
jgi:glycosyltransferase involved in cell wall biosynthesis